VEKVRSDSITDTDDPLVHSSIAASLFEKSHNGPQIDFDALDDRYIKWIESHLNVPIPEPLHESVEHSPQKKSFIEAGAEILSAPTFRRISKSNIRPAYLSQYAPPEGTQSPPRENSDAVQDSERTQESKTLVQPEGVDRADESQSQMPTPIMFTPLAFDDLPSFEAIAPLVGCRNVGSQHEMNLSAAQSSGPGSINHASVARQPDSVTPEAPVENDTVEHPSSAITLSKVEFVANHVLKTLLEQSCGEELLHPEGKVGHLVN
jgi:hypothetical protein